MLFNDHSVLDGKHAILSPSSPSWLNYQEDNEDSETSSLFNRYSLQYASLVGTVLHEYAEKRIRYRLKIGKNEKKDMLFYCLDHGIPQNVIDLDFVFENVMNYVNDAIGFRMSPEVVLYYSENCFGTADSISFDKNILRIHDLKTGKSKPYMEQTWIYAALFCLEYKIKPSNIGIETRIYYGNDVLVDSPGVDTIVLIMDRIISANKILSTFRGESGNG